MGRALVVVESPAKAKTINKFLGKDFVVMASVGHIKDLPKTKLGVDVEKGFEPHYVRIKGKEKTIAELKKAGREAERIYLAPDPDREGEAIAWHIAEEVDKERKKTARVLFNEITERAVREAIKHPTRLDVHKYEAQQARRILDRLVGYQVSPILWEKVKRGLSAGRVQSVAVRLVCDREKEIMSFVPVEYWSVTADLETARGETFTAKVAKKGAKKLELRNKREAKAVKEALEGAPFTVTGVEKKEVKRNPAPPFTTSKLQQEAARKLNFSAKKTMTLAQQLYEGIELGNEGPVGLITYIRTDSTRLADEAVEAARAFILERYGKKYLPPKAVVYRAKKGKKKVQDAHEAIRPTSMRYTPEYVKRYLTKDQFRLYTLIWNRFVACQMAPALFDQTRVEIKAADYVLTAAGSVMKFDGFMALYVEGTDEAAEKKEALLPPLAGGERLKVVAVNTRQHFTQPPPRFTEASLVKELEERGIGRPSTYATILSTIQERGYVAKEDSRLRPTELGFLVNDLLVESFPEILDARFTARLEEELDMIEEGRIPWRKIMEEFYGPFRQRLEKARVEMKNVKAEEIPTDIKCEKCSRPMVIRWGKRGKFLACTGYPECSNTKDFVVGSDGKVEVVEKQEEETEEKCPVCSSPMKVRSGRFGRFLACSRYPECKTTLPYSTGVPCPEEGCDGMIVERRTKKGRIFFGCSRYPKCTFASWKLPQPERG